MEKKKSKYLRDGECPNCNSNDGVNVYPEGYWSCFKCGADGNIDDELIDKTYGEDKE